MCLMDWRLGRFIRTVVTPWAFLGSVNLTRPSSPQRVGIMISGDSSGLSNSPFTDIKVDNVICCCINLQVGSRLFTLTTHGDLPTRSFQLSGGGTASEGSWTEFFLPENELAISMDDLISEYHQWRESILPKSKSAS